MEGNSSTTEKMMGGQSLKQNRPRKAYLEIDDDISWKSN
jgi:hypothetical protein